MRLSDFNNNKTEKVEENVLIAYDKGYRGKFLKYAEKSRNRIQNTFDFYCFSKIFAFTIFLFLVILLQVTKVN